MAATTRFILACTILGCLPQAQAAQPAPLFHDLIEAAWAHSPDRPNLEARRQEAAIRAGAARAFFPNAPVATGTFVDDRAGSAQGYTTYQGELGTPIWLPGEGTATENVARADLARVMAEEEATHLNLAQQLLDISLQAAQAINARDVAQRRLRTAQSLATDLNHRQQLGENARADALVADADAATARVALIDADAQIESARATLATLTGLEAIPRLAAAPHTVAAPENPRIAAARLGVASAEASLRLTRIADRDDPDVAVQGIHEKQFGSPWDTRFGVVVRFPFGSSARNAPRIAAAQTTLTQAQTQLTLAERQVTLELRQARAVLEGARRSVSAAEQAAAQLGTRAGEIERAWRAGEMPLIEVTRARASAFDAELARDKARTLRDAAQLRLLIASGIVP